MQNQDSLGLPFADIGQFPQHTQTPSCTVLLLGESLGTSWVWRFAKGRDLLILIIRQFPDPLKKKKFLLLFVPGLVKTIPGKKMAVKDFFLCRESLEAMRNLWHTYSLRHHELFWSDKFRIKQEQQKKNRLVLFLPRLIHRPHPPSFSSLICKMKNDRACQLHPTAAERMN